MDRASSQIVVRKEQYSLKCYLYIRALGTEEWDLPIPYENYDAGKGPANIIRTTFTPGAISVYQCAAEPMYKNNKSLASALNMWKATFRVADLHDIRVKEWEIPNDPDRRVKIEIRAVCKAPPMGRGMTTPAGVKMEKVMHLAEDRSDSEASSVGIANLSDRWATGEQEIRLIFARSRQIERTPGPKDPQDKKKAVTGPKVWVWPAFLAFLCGKEWSSKTHTDFIVAAQQSLAQTLNSESTLDIADFEKKTDDWVLIKINPEPSLGEVLDKVTESDEEVRRATFGPISSKFALRASASKASVSSAGPSFSSAPPPGAHLSLLTKRKATENVEGFETGEVETLEQLERDLASAVAELIIVRDEEARWKDKMEEVEQKARQLRLQIQKLDQEPWC